MICPHQVLAFCFFGFVSLFVASTNKKRNKEKDKETSKYQLHKKASVK